MIAMSWFILLTSHIVLQFSEQQEMNVQAAAVNPISMSAAMLRKMQAEVEVDAIMMMTANLKHVLSYEYTGLPKRTCTYNWESVKKLIDEQILYEVLRSYLHWLRRESFPARLRRESFPARTCRDHDTRPWKAAECAVQCHTVGTGWNKQFLVFAFICYIRMWTNHSYNNGNVKDTRYPAGAFCALRFAVTVSTRCRVFLFSRGEEHV